MTTRGIAFARRLWADRAGVSILEFALILPILITLGFYGTELAWMAMVNTQVGTIASSVSDNASRLGQTDNSAVTPTVSETMVDSVMTGGLVQGDTFDFTGNGRITLSSVERNADGDSYIRWQRCRGDLKVKSRYGNEGKVLARGIGDPPVMAVSGSAVMFVEVDYTYQPLFGSWFVGTPHFHRESAFLVRDDRNLERGVTPGSAAAKSLCT